ncbi:MAG: dTMP kinase [bacterium (Candidatus Stahlbacteria) CG23_combo_of_CG06-09_8_20_14_all_34_7]|nr:MAG: dTMP kinase [bacterium (Candidatus Stahlbacteria) CG23_combo_of_CG06-09_8_20_14_all_34_7]
MEGIFITFEGIEGCGKSTQANLLYDFLTSKNIECILTHEPGGTPISEKIRNILLDNKNEEMDSLTELFLYFASRAQHTAERIKPALKNGTIVISDRYLDSTLAYQGEGRNIPNQKIAEINNFATGGLIPTLTFLIDIPAETGMSRLITKDRMEKESLEFHNRVRGSFLTGARENKERIKIINGMRPIEEIHKEIVSIVLNYI